MHYLIIIEGEAFRFDSLEDVNFLALDDFILIDTWADRIAYETSGGVPQWGAIPDLLRTKSKL